MEAWEKRVLAGPGAGERVGELEAVMRRSLGRPTRDVNGFWEYGIWDRVGGRILRPHDKESALRYVEGLGNPGDPPRYVVVRRWLGGWEAGD